MSRRAESVPRGKRLNFGAESCESSDKTLEAARSHKSIQALPYTMPSPNSAFSAFKAPTASNTLDGLPQGSKTARIPQAPALIMLAVAAGFKPIEKAPETPPLPTPPQKRPRSYELDSNSNTSTVDMTAGTRSNPIEVSDSPTVDPYSLPRCHPLYPGSPYPCCDGGCGLERCQRLVQTLRDSPCYSPTSPVYEPSPPFTAWSPPTPVHRPYSGSPAYEPSTPPFTAWSPTAPVQRPRSGSPFMPPTSPMYVPTYPVYEPPTKRACLSH